VRWTLSHAIKPTKETMLSLGEGGGGHHGPDHISSLELIEVRAVDGERVGWTGGFFSYGGSTGSATIYFAIVPGERLGRHTDTVEETQFIHKGSGNCASTRALARWRPAM
jgi:hypothetical protein